MENQSQPPIPQTPFPMQPALPNATAALVLGIISIPTCICYGIPGMACGIIAIILGGKALKLFKENPSAYSLSSFNNAKAGRICGIIGVCLSSLYLICIIIYFIVVGALVGSVLTGMPWDKMH